MEEEQKKVFTEFILGQGGVKTNEVKGQEFVLRSGDVDQAVDQILLGILKELPYYNPIHRAIRKPLVELLKKAGVGDPGGDGPAKKDDPEDGHS